MLHPPTRVKIARLVASLPTSRQQVVFALLVPNCQQVWNKLLTICNKLLTICNKLVDIIILVARLFQRVQYSHDITILLWTLSRQPCNILVISWLYQTCWNNLVASLIMPSSLLEAVKACFKLVTTTGNKQCEHNLSTACEQICNNWFADL
jgi:hypothetical protein